MDAERRTARQIATSVVLASTLRGLGLVLGAGVAAVLSRDLATSDFALLQTTLGLAAAGSNISGQGVGQIAVREAATRGLALDRVAGALVVARLILGLPVASLLFGSFLLARSDQPGVLVAAAVLATIPLGALAGLRSLSEARLRPLAAALLLLFDSLLWFLAVAVLAATSAGVSAFGAGFLASTALSSVAVWLFTVRSVGIMLSGAARHAVQLLRDAFPLTLVTVFVMAYYRLDALFVYAITPRDAPEYLAAYRLFDVLQFIPMVFLGLVLPLVSRLIGSGDVGRKRAVGVLALGLRTVPFVAGTVAVTAYVLSPALVGFAFGEKYRGASSLFRVLVLGYPAIYLAYITTGTAIALGMQRRYMVVVGAAAAASAAANYFLLPVYGVAVAAWVTVAIEWFVAAATTAFACRALLTRPPVRQWGLGIAALVAGLLVGSVAAEHHVVFGGGVAAFVGVVLQLGSRVVTLHDVRRLMRRELVL